MNFITALFVLIWAIGIGYWVLMAAGNKQAAQPVSPVWRLISIVLAVLMWVLVRQNPRYFYRPLLPPSETRAWAGLMLTVAGIAFAIWARRTLGRNWSGTPMVKEDHELITRGPYRRVRHPIYTGLLLAVVGTDLARARVLDAYVVVIVVVLLLFKLRYEEKLMLAQFPAAYPEYRRRTPALVPFVF